MAVVIAAGLLACVSPGTETTATPDVALEAERLQLDLEALAPEADPEEARALALATVARTVALAAEYRMVQPALLNNVFINVGLKDRGLCWHWTKDLLAELGRLPLEGYDLHWGTAYPGRLFREHNSVIVTARGAPLASGLVLDPWRESGSLFWVAVGEDRYPWQAH